MGEPVKIMDLAKQLIRFYGYEPGVNMEIKIVGLRPGEKLYEEKLMAEEGLKRTPNKLIHIGNPIPFDTAEFRAQLEELMTAAYDNDDDIRTIVEKMVPTYIPKKD